MAQFEQDLTKLESVVERLERGDLPLEDSVQLFEQGMKLSQACRTELEKAEGRIQVLVAGKNRKLEAADLELQPENDLGGSSDAPDEEDEAE